MKLLKLFVHMQNKRQKTKARHRLRSYLAPGDGILDPSLESDDFWDQSKPKEQGEHTESREREILEVLLLGNFKFKIGNQI